MAIIFQIAPNTVIVKDMVFGWTMIHKNHHIVVEFATIHELEVIDRAIPGGALYEEVRGFVQSRLAKIRSETLKQERAAVEREAKVQANLQHQATLALQAQQERQKVAQRIEGSMRAWFGNLTPVRAYEVKNFDDGWVYARVTPISCGYLLTDRYGVVVGEFKTLSEVSDRILRRWW